MQRHPPPAAGDPRTPVLATGFGERPGDVDPVRGELLGTVDVDQRWGQARVHLLLACFLVSVLAHAPAALAAGEPTCHVGGGALGLQDG
eukprot:6496178-Pyramimonas_sp.AAC.1